MQRMNRREFLKLGSAALAVPMLPGLSRFITRSVSQPPPASLGRIAAEERQAVFDQPSATAEWIAWKRSDDIFPLYDAVVGEAPWPTNPVWYRTDGGYIHSSYVQPVENMPSSEVISVVEKPGFWAQVCVPIAEARKRPDSLTVSRRLYYGTVYRVVNALADEAGNGWYQLQEGVGYKPGPYVPAWSVRRVLPEELAPISPDVPDKRIEVNTQDQTLTCFEGDQVVLSCVVSTGRKGLITPRGKYRVYHKHHTDFLIGGSGNDRYSLPGVPYLAYFTNSGIAIHGTYWHNDYGRPRSHGCINVPMSIAQWIFRWTEPAVPYEVHSLYFKPDKGTPVIVT